MSTLAGDLPFDLGGEAAIAAALAVAAPVDHVTDALGRLPAQFRTKPKIRAMLTALVNPSVAIETALFELLTQRGLGGAVGVQLDTIGEIVGQKRAGLDDTTYELYLRARIATNRSRGNTETLIQIVNLILADDNARVVVDSVGPGAVEVRIEGVDTTDGLATVLISFLRDAVGSGVRAILISAPSDADSFETPIALFSTSGGGAGATTITASYQGGDGRDLAATFPSVGTLVLEPTLAGQETRAYTSRVIVGTSVTFVVSVAFVAAHAAGSLLQLDTVTGGGWGTSADVGQPALAPYANVGNTGGQMADARQ